MMWLTRYELRKTRQSKLILLGVCLVMEAFFLIGIMTRDDVMLIMTYMLLFIAAMGGTLYIGLESVLTLHRDLRHEQGYMIFMTPHSCWAILGAKMLENLISMFISAGFFVGLLYLNASLILHTFKGANTVWITATSFLVDPAAFFEALAVDMPMEINIHVDFRDGTMIICAFVAYVCTWLSFTGMAYLADTLAACILPGKKKLSAVLAFGLFIVLAFLTLWMQTSLPMLPDYRHSLLLASGLALAQTAVMYVVTALMMESRLSI